MTTRHHIAAVGALAATLTLAAPAAAAERGPEVGETPPDFTLEAVSDGTEHTLSELRGEAPVVLVFFRGAW
ncbi:MAG: hypothetical protein ACLF0P_05225 [Thermoanaerobaculia bacterium]